MTHILFFLIDKTFPTSGVREATKAGGIHCRRGRTDGEQSTSQPFHFPEKICSYFGVIILNLIPKVEIVKMEWF